MNLVLPKKTKSVENNNIKQKKKFHFYSRRQLFSKAMILTKHFRICNTHIVMIKQIKSSIVMLFLCDVSRSSKQNLINWGSCHNPEQHPSNKNL